MSVYDEASEMLPVEEEEEEEVKICPPRVKPNPLWCGEKLPSPHSPQGAQDSAGVLVGHVGALGSNINLDYAIWTLSIPFGHHQLLERMVTMTTALPSCLCSNYCPHPSPLCPHPEQPMILR